MDALLDLKQLLFATVVTGAIYALVAIGLNLVYGTMKLLNVAHGEIVMLGGYGAFWAFSLLGISPLFSMVALALAGAGVGVVLYSGLFNRLLRPGRSMRRLESNSLLLFFGISVILQNVTALAFSGTPRGYEHLSSVWTVGGVSMTLNRLIATIVALVVVGSIALYLRYHRFGLSVRALIERRDAAIMVGVDVGRVQTACFMAAFGTAALAGALASMGEQITPFIGLQFTIAAFVVIILGGLGRIGGGIAAAFILAFVETFGVALTSGTWRSILLYGLFVAIILVRPQGLFGRPT